jgi:hypothetical protein
MKKIIILMLAAILAGTATARLGERRLYEYVPSNFLFPASRDPNNWWDDVNDVYTIVGTLQVLDVNIVNTLDVNDVNITGELVLEGFTAGSVLFVGADANVVEDNANFFFDAGRYWPPGRPPMESCRSDHRAEPHTTIQRPSTPAEV